MANTNIHIQQLIAQGEHEQLDFKFEISDSKKIARSIAAFANTHGGRLLVGVKDNGVIAGIRSDEEVFMLQAAAEMYCKPVVSLQFTEWQIEGKRILEVRIRPQKEALIYAPDKNNMEKVFVRVKDENILANGMYIKAWQQKKEGRLVNISYTEVEKQCLTIIKENQAINWSQIRKKLQLKPFELNKILLDFLLIDIIVLQITEKGYFYKLK